MEIILALIVGILLGAFLFRRKPVGHLRIDRSDPTDTPYLFLELSKNVETITRKKYIVLKVKLEDFIPHE